MILPGQKSESMKNINEIKPELGSFTHFVKDPNQKRSLSNVLDTRYSVVILVRANFRVPAPRVWNYEELLLNTPPFYQYHVWLDNSETPIHYWAGPAELITLKEYLHG